MRARPGEEGDSGGRVALVLVVVEIDADGGDGDEFEEVKVQEVRLGPVRLPELGRGRVSELGDGAARFGGGDGPGGERGDFLEGEGRERGWGWCCLGLVVGRAWMRVGLMNDGIGIGKPKKKIGSSLQ